MSDDQEYDENDAEDLDAILNAAQGEVEEVLVDLSEAASFDPLPTGEGSGPDGRYLVEVTESKAGAHVRTKNGDPAWKLVVQVVDPKAPYKSKSARTNVLRGKGAGFTKDYAAAFGFPLDPDKPVLNAPAFVGKRAWVHLVEGQNPSFNDFERPLPYSDDSVDGLVDSD